MSRWMKIAFFLLALAFVFFIVLPALTMLRGGHV